VTESEIIEISSLEDYKAALGRLIAYSNSETFKKQQLQPRLHLYVQEGESFEKVESFLAKITESCGNIRITFGNLRTYQL
jgi:hypothetical protein